MLPNASVVTAPKLPGAKSVVSAVTSVKDKNVKVPAPAAISSFVNEKPKTVVPPTSTVNPASSAAPPEAPVKAKPVTSN